MERILRIDDGEVICSQMKQINQMRWGNRPARAARRDWDGFYGFYGNEGKKYIYTMYIYSIRVF